MENILFKKSYLHKSFKKTSFDYLWNTKGIFTTIRVLGKPKKFLHLDEHIMNLNRSLKILSINYYVNKKILDYFINQFFSNDILYDHLFRIAVNNKKISFSLRKTINSQKKFKVFLVSYQRPNFILKNLKYKKILLLLQSIDMQHEEIILFKNNLLLEGCTTNIICIKNKKAYIPRNGYYCGTTLKFFLKTLKRKIIKKNITKNSLKYFDEILLVGSGKGVVSVDNIPQINWYKRESIVYNEFHMAYKSYIEKQIAT